MQKHVWVKFLLVNAAYLFVLTNGIISPSAVFADNCFIRIHPTSDPAPSVFTYNGITKVYFYCTQDVIGGSGSYPIDTIHCYSSADMFHWKDEGIALDEKSVPWAKQGGNQLWAPYVAYWDGAYRLYAPETNSNGVFYNFCAKSTSPTGPFVAGPPLPGTENNAIDPSVFIDTVGSTVTYYMHFRDGDNSNISIIKLNATGDTAKGSKVVITSTAVSPGFPTGYKEGSWIEKRNGAYYMIFAFQPNNSGNEIIAYATAANILGPWTYKGQILDRNPNEWTIHSGSCNFNGKWYLVYHNTTFGGSIFGSERCSAIEYLTFNSDGTIAPITKTLRGVGIPSAAIDTIQVDRYSSVSGTIATTAIPYNAGESEQTGWYLSGIANNSSVQYNDVDFTPTAGNAIGTVAARVASTNANGTIQVRTGSATGALLGTIPVPNTGALTTWQTTPALTLATQPATGVQNLVLVFSASATGTFNVNWVKFGEVPLTSIRIGDAYIGPSGFAFQRINKNTFTVDCAQEATPAEIRIFNVNGREMAHAVKSASSVKNRMTVDLDAQHFSPGSYILSIKNHGRASQISFIY